MHIEGDLLELGTLYAYCVSLGTWNAQKCEIGITGNAPDVPEIESTLRIPL